MIAYVSVIYIMYRYILDINEYQFKYNFLFNVLITFFYEILNFKIIIFKYDV